MILRFELFVMHFRYLVFWSFFPLTAFPSGLVKTLSENLGKCTANFVGFLSSGLVALHMSVCFGSSLMLSNSSFVYFVLALCCFHQEGCSDTIYFIMAETKSLIFFNMLTLDLPLILF
jgi:hypothetical protein